MSGAVLKYIEIKEGLSVKVDDIEAVGYGDNEFTSRVYTHHNAYDSTFPYMVLLELLEISDANQGKEEREKAQFNIMKELTVQRGY